MSRSSDDSVAVVGMACVFPGARDLAAFWANISSGVCSISDVADRWDPVFYDPSVRRPGRLSCRRGGFIDDVAVFDPTAYGIMPVAVHSAEPDQLLSLSVASAALEDVGHRTPLGDRARTGVVLGRGNYPGAGRIRFEEFVRGAEQLVCALRDLLPNIDEGELDRVRRDYQGAIGADVAASVIGLVPNLTASRIAERLDLGGPAYTVDAACASALIALEHACNDLLEGRADAMLCGGVHVCHTESFWSVFDQLGALSRSQIIRPFDARADGILLSEGAGVLALRRLSDATRDGNRVYAVIRGVGTSSDGKGASLMSPAVGGQLLALERAWARSGLDPASIGLLEGHGTGTPAGDAVELESVARFFGQRRGRAVLGSVKANIGHAMPAAGVAGLIKAALAIHHGVLLQTPNSEEPHPALDATGFSVLQHARPWDASARVAAVSAFGFGGINAHVVLESAPRPGRSRELVSSKSAHPSPNVVVALRAGDDSTEGLVRRLRGGEASVAGRLRAAVVDPSPERIEQACRLVLRGRSLPRRGIFHASAPLLAGGGKVAFVFTGFTAKVEFNVADVAAHFGLAQPTLSTASLEDTGAAIIASNRVLYQALRRLGLRPDALAGHSIGEWSAMMVAGVLDEKEVEAFTGSLRPGSFEFSEAVFLVAGCGLARAQQLLAGVDGIEVSHDNCPQQVILCGLPRAIEVATERLRSENVLVQPLPFGTAMHTRFFGERIGPHEDALRGFRLKPPALPLYSATTCEPYPTDPIEMAQLTVAHMVRRVRFRELVLRMYDDGMRVFVQVGYGSLAGFVESTLGTRPHLALAATMSGRSGMEQLAHVACGLWTEGAEVDFDQLAAVAQRPTSSRPMRLALGVPLVRFQQPLSAASSTAAAASQVPTTGRDAVRSAYEEGLRSIASAQERVVTAYARGPRPVPEPSETRSRVQLSLRAFPELIDHSFYRQAAAWPTIADHHPVVPMTGLLELMHRAASNIAEGRPIAGFENVHARRWLAVAEPVTLDVVCTWRGGHRLHVQLGDYAAGEVLIGDAHARSDIADISLLDNERGAGISSAALYADRWVFHGPAYQGVTRLGPVADNGIRGRIRCGAALGSVLDNAGQLLGYWVASQQPHSLAMPIRVGRLRYLGRAPATGTEVECVVKVRALTADRVVADILLTTAAGPWASIENWEDRRIPGDDRLWSVITRPEISTLSETIGPGLAALDGRYRSALVQQYLGGRYLVESERRALAALPLSAQWSRLAHLIVARDAARSLVWSGERHAIFPAEVTLVGTPPEEARLSGAEPLHVATAECDGTHFAIATYRRNRLSAERIQINEDALLVRSGQASEVRHGDVVIAWTEE